MSNAVNETGSAGNSCAETVPRKNKPNQAKRDVRAFERFMSEGRMDWPDDLRAKGQRALLALKTLDQPNVPNVLVRDAAKDLTDFNTAYAAWSANE